MDSMSAFARGQAAGDVPRMIFDWDKAAKLIRDSGCHEAGAGLRDDWEWTGNAIFRDGKPVPREESYTYLASTWAIPELELDGEKQECFVVEGDTEWGCNTSWPESALKIIGAAP